MTMRPPITNPFIGIAEDGDGDHLKEECGVFGIIGDIDAAASFVQDFPSRGYEVVDALLERGDFDRAKDLFEALEPLSQLHTSKFQHHGDQHNVNEFEKWSRRAIHFRDAEQIKQSIDHLATEGIRQTPERPSEETISAVKRHLRREAADFGEGDQRFRRT